MEEKQYQEVTNKDIKLYVKTTKGEHDRTFYNLVIRVKEYNKELNEYETKEILINNKHNYKYIYHLYASGLLK